MDEPTRTCANCACFGYMGADGQVSPAADPAQPERIPICRRMTPGAKYVRVEVPMLDANNKPIQGPRGPRMQQVQQLQIGYPATVPSATCFDGWRPLGTPPGEQAPAALRRV